MDQETIDRARLGLTLVFLAVAAVAGVIGVTVVIGLLAQMNPFILLNPLVWMFFAAAPIVLLLASGVSIAGKTMCLPSSRTVGRFDVLLLAVVFHAVTGLLAVAGYTLAVPPVVQLLANGLTLAGFVLFLVYLRRLAQHMGEPHLAERPTRLMILCGTIAALMALTVLCTMWGLWVFSFILGFGTLAATGACIVGYSRLLLHTRDALTVFAINGGPATEAWTPPETTAPSVGPFAKPAAGPWAPSAQPLNRPPVAHSLTARPVTPPPIARPLAPPVGADHRSAATVSFGRTLEVSPDQTDAQEA